MRFNVFINVTCVSLTQSSNDNQWVTMKRRWGGGSNQLDPAVQRRLG